MALVERKDLVLQRLVDRGVELDQEKGVVAAWTFMNRHGISEEIILRVLSGPTSRRSANAAPTLIDEA
jgi:hypothetical protein